MDKLICACKLKEQNTDVGSDLRLTEQNLTRAEHTANKALPSWLLPYLLNTELARASRPDIILVLPNGLNHTPHVNVQDLPPSTWNVHLIESKYCDDTRPESQLQKATEQHRRLVAILKAQGCSKVSLHVILIGVMGIVYKSHTDTPLTCVAEHMPAPWFLRAYLLYECTQIMYSHLLHTLVTLPLSHNLLQFAQLST